MCHLLPKIYRRCHRYLVSQQKPTTRCTRTEHVQEHNERIPRPHMGIQ